jgi:alkylation response protein AidB-like acyl-CoA dehydrogenase
MTCPGQESRELAKIPYGNLKIPYSDPAWYRGSPSPHYNDSHVALRDKVRKFVEKEVRPFVEEWEEMQDYPRELHEKAYAVGVYGLIWPAEYGGTPPPNHDLFHDLIYWDELSRVCPGGMLAACFFHLLDCPSSYFAYWLSVSER